PTLGTLEISIATTGSTPDPDGYAVALDGAAGQPIGTTATLTLSNLATGTHRVALQDIATNCTVTGNNPRNVTIAAGETTRTAFTVACTEEPPPPPPPPPPSEAGSISVSVSTSGAAPDPDGYTVAIDTRPAQSLGVNGSRTIQSLPVGAHSVLLAGLASNCSVDGENPLSATVTAGQTTSVAFAVTCAAQPPETGSLGVSVATSGPSPDPDGYTVAVDNRPAQSLGVNGSRTVSGLAAGAHTVLLGGLAANCSVEGDNPLSVTVTAGQTTSAAFRVACVATAPSINLRVERMYLTQSVQRLAGDIPLVQGRDGLLRVFVTASGTNTARPAVRVRLYQNGALAQTLTIPAAGGSTPTSVQQDGLGNSWNVSIPGSLIVAGASIQADVDPDNQVVETNEGDNSFPASSSPQALSVQSAPSAAVRFVPILQTANGLQGSVSNPAQLMELARRMYPLNGVSTDVRPVFTVTGPLQ
ncbi:MAG TPA: CARDB domain-containing protein, partial [Gemmatimonadales bacterium]